MLYMGLANLLSILGFFCKSYIFQCALITKPYYHRFDQSILVTSTKQTNMTSSSDIDNSFKRLDELQFAVFAKINEIIDDCDPTASQGEESIELKRIKSTKDANGLIFKFRDMLKVIEINISGGSDDQLSVKYQIYKEKLSNLRIKLRESQLQSYNSENELVHNQRIAKYSPVLKENLNESDLRNDLFSGRSTKEDSKVKNKTIQDQILSHNKSITSSLQSTRQLMSTSIVQTELNIDSVEQQTKDLSNLNDKFTDFESLLNKSKNIVRFIEKQDRKDKNNIYLSIGFLLLCSAWVIWRRLLKMPVKFFLWSLFKIFRIFNTIFVTSSNKGDVDIYATVGAISSSLIASSILSSSTGTINLDEEFTMSIEPNGEHKTWEDIVSTATSRIVDEL